MKQSEEPIERFPRPKGLTNASISHLNNPTKQNKKLLNRLVITHYLSQSLLYPYPLHQTHLSPTKNKRINSYQTKEQYQIRTMEYKELCTMMDLQPSRVQRLINKRLSGEAKSLLEKNNIDEYITRSRAEQKGLIFLSGNRLRASMGWENELKSTSRASGYKASIVKETNAAIAQNTAQINQLFALNERAISGLKPISQQALIQVNNQINQGTEHANEKGHLLTTTQAINLLEERALNQLPQGTDLDDLEKQYLGPEIPEVMALPSDAQGVRKVELQLVPEVEAKDHENRREIEENIEILDATDLD